MLIDPAYSLSNGWIKSAAVPGAMTTRKLNLKNTKTQPKPTMDMPAS